jgi:hypothetical protein
MPRAVLLLGLLLAAPAVAAPPATGPSAAACPTLWAAYAVQTDGLAAAVSSAQARPQDPSLIARAQALREDLRRALAEIVIAGCL